MEIFTRHKVICVEQDYASGIFTANLQSLVEKQSEQYVQLISERRKYNYKVNKNVSWASLSDVDEINTTIWRSYFSFMRGAKSANSELFKDFWDEAEMEKNKSDGGIYFVIVTKTQCGKAIFRRPCTYTMAPARGFQKKFRTHKARTKLLTSPKSKTIKR